MRKTFTILNSFSGLINKIISVIFVFVVRHYFSIYLATDYLGLEGLFANILGLFSLIDLGLGTAISFNLYEPIHNNDRDTLSAIMKLYRKLYILIGIVIFAMSCCYAPFIGRSIKDSILPGEEIRLYFLIYSFGVAATYFFSYKRTLMFAMQKNYIATNVDSITKVVLSLLQIYVIINYQNYLIYLVLIIGLNLLGNFIIAKILDSKNQYDIKTDKKLPKSFNKKLKEHVKALAITNVAWQGIASTDNIIISAVVGVLDLAKNANYSAIASSINGIFSVILGGASASIGDMLVEKNAEKSKLYFDRYCFIYAIVSAYAMLGVYFVSRPFVTLWVGEKLLFENITVFLIAINIFLTLNFKPTTDYLNYTGNFVYYKPYSIVAVVINLVISIVLGKRIGIDGVFIGTTVTYMFMIIVVVAILSKRLFYNSIGDYFKRLFINIIPAVLSFIIVGLAMKLLTGNVIIDTILSLVYVTAIYLIMIILILHKKEEFTFFKDLVFRIIKNKSIKNL